MKLTQEKLKERLRYDPETGDFFWITARKTSLIGARAGYVSKSGYVWIGIDGRLLLAHRLAWLYMTGEDPKNQIDHIDGVTTRNAWANLRPATRKQNAENVKLYKTNTSGFKGVYFHKQTGKWMAYLTHHGRRMYVGTHESVDTAVEAVRQARSNLFTHDIGRA